MEAKDIMTSPVLTISTESTVGDAARAMIDGGTSCLPVLNDSGQLAGILTHTDFGFHRKFLPMSSHPMYTLMGAWVQPDSLEEVAKSVSKRKVKEVMSHPVITIRENTPMSEAVEIMLQRGINRLPVMREKELVGVITRHDLVKLMLAELAKD